VAELFGIVGGGVSCRLTCGGVLVRFLIP